MFKDKKVIIFDLDGTLLDTIGMWNDVDVSLIDIIGGTTHDQIRAERRQFFSQNTTGNTYMKYAKYLGKRYNSKYTPEQIFELRDKIAVEHLIHHVKFKEHAYDFIKLAKENGFQLAIASLTTKWAMNIYKTQNINIHKKCNIDETFDLILLKDDIEKIKPDPEIYLLSLIHI